MLIELLFNAIGLVIKAIFSFINLPNMPIEAQISITSYFNLIFENLSFLSFFVRPSTLKIVATSAIGLYIFSRLYRFTMWIWHKLPINSK